MYMDQVYQIRAIMEATGEVKDAPVIRELLDEALGARRRKALGFTDSKEPPGQGTAETLHTHPDPLAEANEARRAGISWAECWPKAPAGSFD